MEVFIKAAEFMEIPVRRTDEEPLQKLFLLVRSELNLDLKNIKQEQAKFWKQHPPFVKVICSKIVISSCLSNFFFSSNSARNKDVLGALISFRQNC